MMEEDNDSSSSADGKMHEARAMHDAGDANLEDDTNKYSIEALADDPLIVPLDDDDDLASEMMCAMRRW